MIILISGTNGSGKTYLMRRILDRLPVENGHNEIIRETSKHVRIGSFWGPPYDITILGRYDGPTCGGCDAFSWKGAADDLERSIREEVMAGRRVLLEGLIVATWGKERMARLKDLGLQNVHITTPLEECVAAVNDRRRVRFATAGEEFVPLNPDNLTSKYHCLKKQLLARQRLGIPVHELDREQAFQYITEALRL